MIVYSELQRIQKEAISVDLGDWLEDL